MVKTVPQATRKPLVNTQREIRRQRQKLTTLDFVPRQRGEGIPYLVYPIQARHPPLEKLASALSTCSSNQLFLPFSTIIHHLEYISIHIESSNSWNPKIRSPKDRRVVYLALSFFLYLSMHFCYLPRGVLEYFPFFFPTGKQRHHLCRFRDYFCRFHLRQHPWSPSTNSS